MNSTLVLAGLLLAMPVVLQADTLADLESEARSLLAQGRAMNRADPESCGLKMRTLQPRAKQLEASAKALPESPDKFWLSVTASQLHFCVSCERKLGPEYCGYAADSLSNIEARR